MKCSFQTEWPFVLFLQFGVWSSKFERISISLMLIILHRWKGVLVALCTDVILWGYQLISMSTNDFLIQCIVLKQQSYRVSAILGWFFSSFDIEKIKSAAHRACTTSCVLPKRLNGVTQANFLANELTVVYGRSPKLWLFLLAPLWVRQIWLVSFLEILAIWLDPLWQVNARFLYTFNLSPGSKAIQGKSTPAKPGRLKESR